MVRFADRVPFDWSPPTTAGAAKVGRRALKTASRLPFAQLALAAGRTGRFLARSARTGKVAGAHAVDGVREPRLSAALTAQVAMDELVLAVMNNPSRVPEPSELTRVGEEVDAARELFEARGWLETPQDYHRDPPPLERPGVRPARWLGLRYEKLIFDSQYEPWPGEPGRDRWLAHEANRTAYAWVLRHDDGPRPWLVCLHGFGTGRAFMDLYAFRAAFLHHVLGLNLAVPVHPMHGPRSSSRFSGADFMSHDLLNVVHGMSQSVWDSRRIVSWIRATQEPTAVGVYGVSLGGYVTALLASFEDDLDCAIAGIPICDLPVLFEHHSPSRLTRDPQARALLGEQVADVLSVVSPLSFGPRVPRERRFMFAGLVDRMATPQQAVALWEHWDRPEIAWYGGNHVGYLWSDRVDTFVRRALTASGLARAEAA